MSVVKYAENNDAVSFKNAIEERISEKVVTVLDALKVEVASNFFNQSEETVSESGGTSGGVKRVWKKPSPKGKGKASAPQPHLPGDKE